MDTAPAPNTAPLTVAYVGNFRRPWCTEVHVAGSLEQLGHRVVRLQEDQVDWRRLPRRVADAGAGLLLWTRTWHVDLDDGTRALDALRRDGVPSASFHLDRWFGLEREPMVDDEPFFRTDVVVSPDDQPEKWAAHDVNHLWMPPGVYAAECGIVPAEPDRWPFDVVFVGGMPYPHPEWHPVRQALHDAFRDRFGPKFAVLPGSGRPIRGKDLQSLYATVPVVLGDSCLAGDPVGYWSDRVPETLGRGGLLIHPDAGERFREWYVDLDEAPVLLTYPAGEPDVAALLAAEVLEDVADWRPVRDRARALTVGRDTYAHRMTQLLDHMEALHGPLRRQVVPDAPTRGRARPRPSQRRTGGNPGPSRSTPAGTVARVTHPRARQRVEFVCPEGSTDVTACHEVWTQDTYRLRPEQVRGGVVVDVGANVGAFSVLAVKLGAATVHAYEPHPATFDALVANVERNGAGKRVECRKAAVLAKGGGLTSIVGAGGGANVLPDSHAEGVLPVAEVEAIVDVLATAGRVTLLKVDCEGSEYDIFDGMGEPEFDRVARIVMEFHGPVMPHLAALDADGRHEQRWRELVSKLATFGKVTIEGRPMVGGLIWWDRY